MGDTHKIVIKDNKMKFKKINKNVIPTRLQSINGVNDSNIFEFFNNTISTKEELTLSQWLQYGKSKDNTIETINDIFEDDDNNFEQEISTDIWQTHTNNIILHSDYQNIGIGTTTPGEKLHIIGNTKIEGTLTTNNLDVIGDITKINTETYTSENLLIDNTDADGESIKIYHNNANYDIVSIYTKGTNSTKVFTITNTGFIGISHSTPDFPLHIQSSAGKGIRVDCNDIDTEILRFTPNDTYPTSYGGALKYHGTGSGNTNKFSITMDNQIGTNVEALSILQNGNTTFSAQSKFNDKVGINSGSKTLIVPLQVGPGTNTSGFTSRSSVAILSGDSGGPNELCALSLINSRQAAIGTACSLGFNLSIEWGPSSKIKAISTESNQSSDLTFETHTGSSLTEKMRISNNGKVGIGTDNPTDKLTVYDGRIKIHQNSTSDNAVLHLLSNTYNTYLFTDKTSGSFYIRSHNNNDVIISSGGSLGIGTTPSSKLHVHAPTNNTGIRLSTNSQAYYLYNSDNSNSGGAGFSIQNITDSGKVPFRIKGTGEILLSPFESKNIGIGTISPSGLLHIAKTGIDNTIQDQLILECHNDSPNKGNAILFKNRWSGQEYWDMARIKAIEEPGYGGALIFETNNGSGSGDTTTVEAMRIDEYGNIGIGGVTVPEQKIDMRGSNTRIQIYGNSNTDVAGIRISSNNNSGTAPILYLYANGTGNCCEINSRTNHDIKFLSNNLERMIITNDGRVGIGTMSPGSGYKLDVNGSFNCTTLNVGGSPFNGGLWSTSSPSTNTSNIFYNDNSSLTGTPYLGGSIVTITGNITDNQIGSGFKSGLIVERYNRTQGLAIGYNGVMQCGSDGDAHLHLRSKGTNGKVFIGNNVALPLTVTESKVGINNSNPSYPLDVSGDINLTGSIYKNNLLLNTATIIKYNGAFNSTSFDTSTGFMRAEVNYSPNWRGDITKYCLIDLILRPKNYWGSYWESGHNTTRYSRIMLKETYNTFVNPPTYDYRVQSVNNDLLGRTDYGLDLSFDGTKLIFNIGQGNNWRWGSYIGYTLIELIS